jgi:hypothetical protein
MSVDTTGSLRKVTLDGITFDTAADADVSQIRGQFTNSGTPSSGRNMKKSEKRVEEVSGVDLLTNAEEFETLKALSERTKDFPMSYTTAAGDVYRASGFIDLEKRQTQDGKTTIKMIPRFQWEVFVA